VTGDQLEILDDRYRSRSVREHFGYEPDWGLPSAADREAIRALMEMQAV
jgi:hypothetical protein